MKRLGLSLVVGLVALLLLSILSLPGAAAQTFPPPGDACPMNPGCSISLSPSSGPVGTVVTVTASDFYPNDQYSVYFSDGVNAVEVTSGLTGTGFFTDSFSVPSDAPGDYTVFVFDSVDDNASAPFTIPLVPTLALSPSEGVVGSSTTAMGAGFPAYAGPITFFLAGTDAVVTTPLGCYAISDGTFSCAVTVPAVPNGDQPMVASDTVSDTASATFTVDANVMLSPTSGLVGSLVTTSGTGFTSSSPTVTFTFEGAAVTSTCATDPSGSFPGTTGSACTFTVPAAPNGDAGGQNLVASDADLVTASASFTVTGPGAPLLTITPSSGFVGSPAVLLGVGFTSGDAVQAIFAGADQACDEGAVVVATDGSFACTLAIPAESDGAYIVSASTTDDGTISATSSFQVLPQMRITGPGTGPPGTLTEVTASGFFSGDTVAMQFGPTGVTCTNGDPQTVAGDGSFVCNFVVPPSSPSHNPYTVEATTADDGSIDATDYFTITAPALTLTPTGGPVGTSVTVAGTDFVAGATVSVTGAAPFSVAFTGCTVGTSPTGSSVTTDVTGAFSCTFAVPPERVGAYLVWASDGSNSLLGGFSVSGPPLSFQLSPPTGPVGAAVVASGTDFLPLTTVTLTPVAPFSVVFTGCTVGTSPTGSSVKADATGAFSCTFTVAPEPAGPYSISASDGSNTALTTFTVTAALSPQLSITSTPTTGPVGTSATITGSGFSVGATINLVLFDGKTVTCSGGKPTVGAGGAFTCTFNVPALGAGVYSVTAHDKTDGTIASTNSFTVTPQLIITSNPLNGPVGTSVKVSGSGFTTPGAITQVQFGGTLVACQGGAPTVGATGAFTCKFNAPDIAWGGYAVTAKDSTNGPIVSTNIFTVTATLKLSPALGPIGKLVTASGTGFTPGVVSFALAGGTIVGTCTALATGSFSSCSITIAAGPYGSDPVTATNAPSSAVASFTVAATLKLSPASGPVGTIVTASGTGFTPGTIGFTIAGGTVLGTCTALPTGSFSACSITITAGPHGADLVTAASTPSSATALFKVTTPSLTLTKSAGPVGTVVTLTGSGYAPSTTYTLCLQPTKTACSAGGTFTTSAGGAIPAGTTITIPSVSLGSYFVDLSQGSAPGSYIISAIFVVN